MCIWEANKGLDPRKYAPSPVWSESLDLREQALRHRHIRHQDTWSEHTRTLTPLKVGDRVRIQNQTGPHPKKWDRTGVVIEVRQYHQYLVRVDGSGKQTLRNRRFLRRFTPVHQPPKPRSILEDLMHHPPPTVLPTPHNPPTATPAPPPMMEPTTQPPPPAQADTEFGDPSPSAATPPPVEFGDPSPLAATPPPMVTDTPIDNTSTRGPPTEPSQPTITTPQQCLRRSTRAKKPPDRLM